MIKKEKRTLDLYKQAGARIKLIQKIFFDGNEGITDFLKSSDIDSMHNLRQRYEILISRADLQMFQDHENKNIDNLNDVFYGNSITDKPLSNIDRDIMKIAMNICFEIYTKIKKELEEDDDTGRKKDKASSSGRMEEKIREFCKYWFNPNEVVKGYENKLIMEAYNKIVNGDSLEIK